MTIEFYRKYMKLYLQITEYGGILEKWRFWPFLPWKNGRIMLILPWKNGDKMIKRQIYNRIVNFYKITSKALLITGARQVGKTYIIREFGKTFDSFIEINFVDSPEAVSIFEGAKSHNDILMRLSLFTEKPLIKGKTLIFFDEVQKCREIVSAIKFLVEEGSYRYILSGSLLGVELKDLRSEPVGYMGVLEMFPLDFKEFFHSVGVSETVIDTLKKSWETKTPVDEVVHTQLMQLFRLYLVVGGMPAAVKRYLDTNNLRLVLEEQKDIIKLYRRDISQYAPEKEKLLIRDIFDLIPPELNSKNKRFILKSLHDYAKFESYEDSFLWLTSAGVAIPTYNVDEPRIPLLLSRSRNLFKLFQNDVGLLASQYADGIQLKIINGDDSINHGAIYENAVAQELLAHGFDLYYYNNKKRGEIDFLIEIDGEPVPVEVKSGKDYAVHRALANIMDVKEYDLKRAYILCNSNIRSEGKLTYLPVYMAMFIQKPKLEDDIIYIPDISSLTS